MITKLSQWRLSRAVGAGLFAVLACLPSTSSQLTGTGLSVTLSGISYFISPFTAGSVSVGVSSLAAIDTIYGFAPVTIVQETIAQDELVTLFGNWTASDDVFQDGFTGIVFLGAVNHAYKLQRAATNTTSYQVVSLNSTAPSGPYFLEVATGALHQAYRLYDDFAGSFSTPLLQTPEGSFQPLSAQVASSATVTVGVPSRLYFTKTADKPLAGVRIGVKVCAQS